MRIRQNRPPGGDAQQARPVVCCALCGRALYESDEFYAVNGLTVCEGCLAEFAREGYRPFRLSGREWRTL